MLRKLKAIQVELQNRIDRLGSLDDPTEMQAEYLDAYMEALEAVESAVEALVTIS